MDIIRSYKPYPAFDYAGYVLFVQKKKGPWK